LCRYADPDWKLIRRPGIWTDQYGGRRVYTVVMLAAAVATFLLAYAQTYVQILIAALGVGIAGGSFAVGIAYVSRWYPQEKQGTALGIFGVGNIGAAVTKFVAPFVLVAYGWQMTAQVWAWSWLWRRSYSGSLPATPMLRPARGKAENLWLELAPPKNIQVWRFSLYFFVFGAFVALSSWLLLPYGRLWSRHCRRRRGRRRAGGYFPCPWRASLRKYGARRVMY
jgi:NNP family nitrate/nitrite transporter-like MFS transporter